MTQIIRELPIELGELKARLDLAPEPFFYRDGETSFCGAFPAETSSALDPSGLGVVGGGMLGESLDIPRWVGALPYEAFRSLERGPGPFGDPRLEPMWTRPLWKRYPAVVRIQHQQALVVGESAAAVNRLFEQLSKARVDDFERPTLRWATPPESAELHRVRILRALEAIERGALYQVNLARRFQFQATGSVLGMFSALERSGEAPYGAAFSWGPHSMISLSPELFIDAQPDGRVITRPIKGTRPRGGDQVSDRRAAAELEGSEKERAELTMVVDLERNDLGRVAQAGSVRLSFGPEVIAYPTVLHREAEVEAVLEPGTSWARLLTVMCPSGSVTGAPKVSAMDHIARLEAHRRGLYTGALGYVSSNGVLRLSMAIRNLTLQGETAHYFSGGGIVADSDPEQEVEETLWKAEQLSSLVSLNDASK